VPPNRGRRLLGWLLLFLILAAVGWFGWVYWQIKATAQHDEARQADAIAVFGAAEYRGRPSPVLHARLDHAVALYQRQIAPLIITLGGSTDRGSGATEGGVGRDYLLANGGWPASHRSTTSPASSSSATPPTSSAFASCASPMGSRSIPRHAHRSATSATMTPSAA
jgi:hypothetical protein